MEIELINYFPKEENGWYWEFSFFPTLEIARDPQEGLAVGIGWLFWTLAIFVDL